MMRNVEASYRITASRGLRLYVVAFAALWFAILALVMLDATGPWRSSPLIVALVGGLWFARILSLAVEVNAEGVVVRNLFRTTRLPWERIDGFRVQRGLGYGSPLGRTVSLLLDGGDALTLDASMRTWGFTGGHQQVREMAAKLQASREAAHRQRADGTA
jgi:hypothetical protein